MHNSTTLPRGKHLQWGWIFGAALLSLAALMALHYAYLTFYSHVLHPDRDMAFLQQHVRSSGPWFVLVTGAPLLFAVCRFVGRSVRSEVMYNCLAIGLAIISISTVMLVMADDLGWRALLSHASILLGSYLGGRSAQKTIAAE